MSEASRGSILTVCGSVCFGRTVAIDDVESKLQEANIVFVATPGPGV